jgi:retinol-binding protein 3
MKRTLLSLFLGLIVLQGSLVAQTSTSSALDAKARAEVIDALTRELNRAYVFPDKATALERDLRARQTANAYDAISDVSEFARLLTEHLQAITKDKHLRVGAGPLPSGPPSGGGGAPPSAFGESRRLEGNVAYVQINTFGMPPAQVREQTRTVMSAAADAAALIIDLRTNGGGNPGTVALISSYLFGEEPVHLNSLYWRAQNRTEDFYTDPKVEGKKFGPTKPVFVLTSSRTFSAAEEFTYNLQTRKRATIVGETTGGGAHPGGGVNLPHGMRAFIPSGRAINPITKTNWEGVGVKPDVAVAANAALDTAHKLAREAVGRQLN